MMTEARKADEGAGLVSGRMPIDQNALLRLASDGSAESRRRLLGVMRDLQGELGILSDRERALVGDILRKLVRDLEAEVRQRLAAILSEEGRPRVPLRMLELIREGEIDVARRLLLGSPLLNDSELIEIVHHRAQQHRLAMALRQSLGFGTDMKDDVMAMLLSHADPAIAAAAVDYLVDEGKRVDSFQEPTVRRAELSRPLVERVSAIVAAALRAQLLDRFDTDPGAVDDALEIIVRDGAALDRASEDLPSAANRLAGRLGDAKLLGPDLLLRVLRQGEVALFESMLAVMAAVPTLRMRRVLADPGDRALAVVCRALNLPRGTFGSIYLLRSQHDDARVRDPASFTEALAFFDGVSAKDALDLLRLWRRDPMYVEAVEQLRSL